MADNWVIVDLLDFHGSIKFSNRTKKIEIAQFESGVVNEISPTDINVMLVGLGASLDSSLLYHISKNDIVIVFCGWNGVPTSCLYPWSNVDSHGRIGARHQAQASLSVTRRKEVWRRIVRAKIIGQSRVLSTISLKQGKYLSNMRKEIRPGDTGMVEARAARYYWSHLFPGEEFSRRPGQKEGGRNSLLDYGYTVLRGYAIRSILAAGLLPSLGVFHHRHDNCFALADDLIEPFRPIVDYAVVGFPQDVDASDKVIKRELLEFVLGVFGASEKRTPSLMVEFARSYAMWLEDESQSLSVPVFEVGAKS